MLSIDVVGMGDLVELSYRLFPWQLIQKLIHTGYLLPSERHKPTAVKHAWDRLMLDVEKKLPLDK